MFSGYPYGAQPWSGTGRDVRAYFDMVMDMEASLTLKIYVSNAAGYATKPGDTPPNQPFRGVLQSFTFERSIMGADIGKFTTGEGNLTISNADAGYDFLPISYDIDGRPITVRVGDRRAAYDQAFTLARVTASGWNINTETVSIDLVDFSYKLEVPMQANVYGGTGGADGGADLAGKRKPLAFGKARNVTPVLLVPASLIYQVHDGAIQAIDVVYDRGVPLTAGSDVATYALLVAASVASGSFVTCKALGLFRIGSAAAGTVTVDVKGGNASGYIVRTADIVRWALLNRTVLVVDDLDAGSFDAVNASQPAPIDYFVGPDDDLTVAALIEKVMGGIGGWGGHRLDGKFEVRIFRAPTEAPVASFDRSDMIDGDIKREPLPAAYRPPRWRWRVPYARCWTVQTDLANGVTAARKAFVGEQWRLAEANSATIKTDHPFAQDRDPVDAYFSEPEDAMAEANRLIALFKTTRAIYTMPLPRRALRLDMGNVITVTHPRFDLSAGRAMVVVSVRASVNFQQAGLDTVEVSAYG